jgi:RND superfamily putative drug exporter
MRISGRTAAAIVRLRWWIVAAWVVLAVALLPGAVRVEQRLEVSASVTSSESARAASLLATRFPSALADYAVLVIDGVPSPTTAAGRAALDRIRKSVDSLPVVTRTVSYLDTPDTLFTSARGGTFMVVGLATAGQRPEELVPTLRQASSRAADELRATFPALRLEWTGEIALNYDLRRVSAADAEGAERKVLPLTLVLLIVAFGAVAAAFLPLVAGGLAIGLSLGAAVVVTRFFPLSILLQNVVTMLGLGLGIDYALLVVARFREGLARGLTSHDAARETIEQAGHTIIISGASVAIGFAALLFMPVNEIRSLAVGGLLVITISILLAVTLVPALLAALGRRVNWGRIRGQVIDAAGSVRWRNWGRFVCARPITVLLVAGIPLVAIATQATRLTTNLPRPDWLPSEMESARALHRLGDMERSGIVQSIRVVVHLPNGVTWDSPAGWTALRRASEDLAHDRRVARVRSLTTTTGLITPNLQLLASMPKDLVGSLGSSDGRMALIDVFPTEAVTANQGMDFVRELRRDGAAHLTGLAGATMDVGGLPALNADYESSITGKFLTIVGLVVGLTTLALLLGFRSVMIAVKAVLLNLLSVATAFGAVVLVFQDGIGIRLLGLSQALGGNFPAIPVIVFAIVFGLSMDYEIFLVSRIAEARRAGMSDRDAIAEGLSRTGGLITSAASIMIVVFAAFTLGDFVLIKILGFALSVAVLVDATVVRMAIGPALLMVAGKWNWWPGDRRAYSNVTGSPLRIVPPRVTVA